MRLSADLERQGFHVMPVRGVRMEIDHGSVRFFWADERKAARVLLAAITATGADPAAAADWALRDFSSYAQHPQPGTVEVWLPSGPPATRSERG